MCPPYPPVAARGSWRPWARWSAPSTTTGQLLAGALAQVLLEGGFGLLGGLAGVLLRLLEELHELLIAGLLGVLDVLLGVGGGLEGMV